MCDSRIILVRRNRVPASLQNQNHAMWSLRDVCIHVKILVLRIPVKVRMNESHFHVDEGRDISCVITREQQGLIIPVVQVTKTESDGEKI